MIRIDKKRIILILAGLFGFDAEGILYISIPNKQHIFVAYSALSGKDDETIDVRNVRFILSECKVLIEITLNDGFNIAIEY